MDIKVKHPKFYPIGQLDGKPNLKRIFRIFPDGSIVERAYLHVSDIRHRELLICLHYLKHITRNFLQECVGMEILSRDDPWDFKLKLNNERILNIEITSIADNSLHFENHKKEERLAYWSGEENIPLHELKKLVSLFPQQHISKLVNEFISENISVNELVVNPYYPPKGSIIQSSMYETNESLTDILLRSIEKKINKKHSEKENTILIIDNRTGAYDVDEYFVALNNIHPLVDTWPFPEIWFYTGYYSDNQGNDAEFSFSPLKATPEQHELLDKLTKDDKVDESGRYVWT